MFCLHHRCVIFYQVSLHWNQHLSFCLSVLVHYWRTEECFQANSYSQTGWWTRESQLCPRSPQKYSSSLSLSGKTLSGLQLCGGTAVSSEHKNQESTPKHTFLYFRLWTLRDIVNSLVPYLTWTITTKRRLVLVMSSVVFTAVIKVVKSQDQNTFVGLKQTLRVRKVKVRCPHDTLLIDMFTCGGS